MPSDEIARNRNTARQMLTEVHTSVASAETDEDKAKLGGISHDVDIFLDLATLWHNEAIDKAIGAYQTASNIFRDSSSDGETQELDVRQIRTASNLGSLFLLQGNVDSAEREYQYALERLANETGQDAEVLKTGLAYNLARAYEENGDVVKASQWYRDVLRQHPEHMECRSRAIVNKNVTYNNSQGPISSASCRSWT
jgi:RNA polymerase-associated protein CTR9